MKLSDNVTSSENTIMIRVRISRSVSDTDNLLSIPRAHSYDHELRLLFLASFTVSGASHANLCISTYTLTSPVDPEPARCAMCHGEHAPHGFLLRCHMALMGKILSRPS